MYVTHLRMLLTHFHAFKSLIVGSVINGRHCEFLCRDTDCWCAAGRGAALGRGDSSCQELLFRHDTSPPFQHAAYQHLHHLQNSSHFSCLPLGPYLMLMHKNVTRTEFYHWLTIISPSRHKMINKLCSSLNDAQNSLNIQHGSKSFRSFWSILSPFTRYLWNTISDKKTFIVSCLPSCSRNLTLHRYVRDLLEF